MGMKWELNKGVKPFFVCLDEKLEVHRQNREMLVSSY